MDIAIYATLIIVVGIGLEIFKENNKWDAPKKEQALHFLKCLFWPVTAIYQIYLKRKNNASL